MMYYIIFAFVFVLFISKIPSVKGFFGELTIRILLKFLDKDNYKVINDVMIPSGDGKTAQIDHIVVSVYGIFVIETKNYNGWIFGSESSQRWTQVIYKTKNQFYNPIMQNKTHVKALQDLLMEYPRIKYVPIVVFTLKSNFKKLNVTSHVVYSLGLLSTIKRYNEENILASDLEKISQVILTSNNDDKVARKEHVTRIQENKSNIKNKVDNGKCPWCEGQLVERQGKNGRFTGCRNFPKCRFVIRGK